MEDSIKIIVGRKLQLVVLFLSKALPPFTFSFKPRLKKFNISVFSEFKSKRKLNPNHVFREHRQVSSLLIPEISSLFTWAYS